MKVFYGKSKIDSFKILPSKIENVDLISSMSSYYADIEKITHFMLHIVNNYLPIKSPYLYK